MNHRARILRTGRKTAFALCLFLIAALVLPVFAQAQSPGETVRVGWYESTFNYTDRHGRRSGYGYEYQMKVASYSGWKYEYISGSWSVLMDMLMNGEIDLLSDVSYTPERAEKILYTSMPMGTEEYYLFISQKNREIMPSDYSTLNGKRIGVNKDSIQADFYLKWAAQNDVQAELVELTCSEDESLSMVERGDLDAYVTVDAFVKADRAVPVCKVGASDFYFAVSQKRPDLLSALNDALNRIQDEDRYYNQRMFEKHIKRAGANAFLSTNEVDWLARHGTIRVGYQDDYLAFCAADKKTGELTGILKDYLTYAADCLANTHIDFEPVAYPTSAAAMEALAKDEVDCVFPANLSVYDGEKLGLMLSPSLVSTDVYAVVRQSERKYFLQKEHVIVAVNEGNPNYDGTLMDHFPNWRKVYFANTHECLKAVSDGVADCVLISNYRYNNIARECERYRLTTLTTGIDIDFCFAVGETDTEVYSIMTKTVGLVPDSTVNGALSYYIAEDARITLTDFIINHLVEVIIGVGLVLLVIIVLLVQNMRAARKAKELIAATENDKLTGLYNRNFFFQYANRMFREHPETPMDAIVLNIDQFHSVNALNGRAFGDEVLRTLGNEIRDISARGGGIAGRFEADRFDIYLGHTKDYRAIFDRLQDKMDALTPNANLRLRMGVMPGQARLEPEQLFDRARTACAMARGDYKEHLVVFDEKVRNREMLEQRLLSDLRRAVSEFEFEVYYQPQYDIRYETPKLIGAEALVRWHHPELGMIAPDDFIPLFERNGQVCEVDRYVWEEAARQVTHWREQYGITIPVSVNLSRVDVFDPKLEETLDGVLNYSGLSRDAFKLEVTETAYMENANQLIQVVESLRAKGYRVEMDDFGTGYSSLSMLSAMPIDVLKMDRAFIKNIDHDEKGVQLVALILGIAKSLRVSVVAEGVETEEQVRLLKKLGCTLVQGYYFSRPMHAADFESLLTRDMKPGSDERPEDKEKA